MSRRDPTNPLASRGVGFTWAEPVRLNVTQISALERPDPATRYRTRPDLSFEEAILALGTGGRWQPDDEPLRQLYNRKPPRIYIAGKAGYAPFFRQLRDEHGLPLRSSWLDERFRGQLTDTQKVELWTLCEREASECDLLILYSRPDDVHKGALVEAGCALGNRKPVYQVGSCGSLVASAGGDAYVAWHPLWRPVPDIGVAISSYLDEFRTFG